MKTNIIAGYFWLALAIFNLVSQFNGADTGYAVIGSLIMSKLCFMHADLMKMEK